MKKQAILDLILKKKNVPIPQKVLNIMAGLVGGAYGGLKHLAIPEMWRLVKNEEGSRFPRIF